jgi:hypothetical protein
VMLQQADVLDHDDDENTSELTRHFYHRNALGSVLEITDMLEATAVTYACPPRHPPRWRRVRTAVQSRWRACGEPVVRPGEGRRVTALGGRVAGRAAALVRPRQRPVRQPSPTHRWVTGGSVGGGSGE